MLKKFSKVLRPLFLIISLPAITLFVSGGVITNDPPRSIISCGAEHGLMLRTDGTVWVWGVDSSAQFGGAPETATNWFSFIPSRIPNVLGAISVAAGDYHSLVLQYDGTVLSFGKN